MTAVVHVGDCREVLALLEADSVHACVTDPPYGLGFMGKDWDHGIPGVHFWQEVLRVLKPGAHLVAFGGTRTYHRLACAIEDAGFEIRDCLGWLYGSGFPKSLDVSKAIDKSMGAEREVTRHAARPPSSGDVISWDQRASTDRERRDVPASEAAQKWSGWGTALKPAWEPIILARKPLAGTVAANVQEHGTGAMNIDGCRIQWRDEAEAAEVNSRCSPNSRVTGRPQADAIGPAGGEVNVSQLGRWPANICHDGSDEVLAVFPESEDGVAGKRSGGVGMFNMGGHDDWGGYGGNGSASRFFYCAKASREDRNEGLHGFDERKVNGPSGDGRVWDIPGSKATARSNYHPTVKPTDLMRWLCRLITPPGGTIIDPFMGSGSTGKAAVFEGFDFIGIELDPAYAEIARARINGVAPLFTQVSA